MSQNRVWFVTGTSPGIGKEIAKAVLKGGDKVIAAARNLDSIKDLKELGAHTMQLDVTLSEKQLSSLMNDAINVYGQIDILVNNAAFAIWGSIEETSEEETEKLFSTNFFGPLKLIKAVLPHMRSRRTGVIVNISSLAGVSGFKASSLYPATKFALEGLSESLKDEVQHLGIKVLVVEPGFFRTELASPNNMVIVKRTVSDYDQHYNEFDLTSIHHKQSGDPKKLAERLFDVVTQSGSAQGREIPFRLPIGDDAYPFVSSKYEKNLEELANIKDLTSGTSFQE